jgi:4-diphosphocytidyl-2-C-methyl-D-erythritol kinase
VIHERAPAKVNLVLQVGDLRDDGLHELCSLFATLDLADELTIEPLERDAAQDRVECPGVTGPNLVTRALAELRAELQVDLPALAVTIDKRIPVAAGLGGGSADAAAVLRAGNELAGSPLDADALRAIGARIGADVPSQVDPRHALVTGAGEHVDLVALPPMALVLIPQDQGLSTADVYRAADRIGSTRPQLDPDGVRALARAPIADLAAALENDPEPAAGSGRCAARTCGRGRAGGPRHGLGTHDVRRLPRPVIRRAGSHAPIVERDSHGDPRPPMTARPDTTPIRRRPA